MCPYLETVKSLHPLSNNQTATCAPELISIFTSRCVVYSIQHLSALHDSIKCIFPTTDLSIKKSNPFETLEGHVLLSSKSSFPKLIELILPLQIPLETLLLSHAWVAGSKGKSCNVCDGLGISWHKSSTLNQKSYLKRWDFIL